MLTRNSKQYLLMKWRSGYCPKVEYGLFGLALSGGGIRSATYALGVLQRLARWGVLKFVDLFSTASGGGYLGACWSSLTTRSSSFGTTKDNFPFKFIDNKDDKKRQIFDRETDAVRHLRAHGNWLLPHLGLFDVWTWIALFRYLSSTAINLLLIPIPWFLGIMIFTMLIPIGFWNRQYPLSSDMLWPMVFVPAFFFTVFMVFYFLSLKGNKAEGAEIKRPLYKPQKYMLIAGVLWVMTDIFVLGIAGAHILVEELIEGKLIEKPELWMGGTAVGGSGAVLAAAGGTIYRFFTGAMQGGVATDTAGASKKAANLVVGSLGYIALAVLLIAAYCTIEYYLFPNHWEGGLVENKSSLAIALAIGAIVIALGMLFMPMRWMRWFLNTFSMQVIYRRGLEKAYILRETSEKEREKTGKTVIPRPEELKLTELKKEGENPPDMPYHLIVSTINTSGDKQLERLGRRSDGMVLAHLHSGSSITGYERTGDSSAFQDISLGKAMTISGAAISPNMGRLTTTSNAILMALLNIRIGTWIEHPKPKDDLSGKYRPRRPLVWFWLKEMFGMASADDRYIYLSDGGHFDNSAIYELFKRRCKYILAIDASSNIGNLATVCRLARIDFGVQVYMDLDPFRPDPKSGLSKQPYVVARIKYPPVEGDGETEGVLIWLSTTMIKKQKPDVSRYRETDSDFPFHSTIDQFFDQSQFEAYRQLGYTAAGVMLEDAELKDEVKDEVKSRQQLEQALEKLLKKVTRAGGGTYADIC
jgi:predicted acylesterase/phospholipase RssA